MSKNALAQRLEQGRLRLDDELDLRGPLDLVLPAIDGGEAGQLVDAGRQPPVEQLFADEVGTGLIRAGAKHQNGVSHGEISRPYRAARRPQTSGYYT